MAPDYVVAVDLGQVSDPTAICVLERKEQLTGRQEVRTNLAAWFGGHTDEPRYYEAPQTAGFSRVVHLERLELGTAYTAIPERLRVIDGRIRQSWLEAVWEEERAAVHAGHRVTHHPTRFDAPVELVVDMTGVGRPVVDLLREDGLAPVAVTITGGDTVIRVSEWEYRVPKRELVSSVNAALQARRLKAAASLADWPVLKAELSNFKAKISLSGHDSYAAGPAEAWREGAHDDLVLALALGVWWGEYEAQHRPGLDPVIAAAWR